VAGIVARGVEGPVVLVRSRGQSLPPLPEAFELLDDEDEGRGPLGGLSRGLAALQGRCEVAYVSSTDVPFLHPAFVRRVLGGLGEEVDACVPVLRGFRQPLSAAYRVGLTPLVRRLLDSDQLRLSSLLETCHASELDEAALLADQDLARFDPRLESVTNLNDPDEYRDAALRPPPSVRVEWSGESALAGTPAKGGPSRQATVRAATLGAAAAAMGTELGSGLMALLNGDRVRQDPEEPLVEGDVVSFVRTDTAL
jgi:molybdopterin-guanine dinucleotide biosynthesis protein A